MYFGRKRKYAAKLRAQERKKPSRIISLLLVISMLCGNFVGMPTGAAEMVAYCGMEEHTHSEACYCAVQAAGEAAAETLAAAVPTEETAAETTEETTAPTEETALSVSGGSDAQALIGEYVEKELCCGMEEHKHDIACYSNPLADLETAAVWEATLPEKLSGDWGKDLAEVAKSQLGYAESAANYLVGADGETLMGYSRYGAWYSSYTQDEKQAYADWNVPFLFFCLYYAGVEDFPIEEDCADWTAALAAAELWREAAGEYIPEAGDLVFLDTDEDGAADRAAVVTDWDEAKVTAVESDSEGAVKTVTYDLTEDTQVLGYGDTNEAQAQIEVSGGEDAETLAVTGTGISGYIGNSFSNGGTFYLSGDAWTEQDSSYADLYIDSNTTIDLNGHKLTISKTDQAFHVTNGATLTILDSSRTVTPTKINQYQISGTNSDNYGKLATMSGSVLTYYVTVPSIQADGISTKETVVQYQADLSSLGSIVGAGGNYAIYCDNGNLTINNGYITNGGGKHAICVKTDSTAAENNRQKVNINGGYICGTTGTEKGGGIYFGGGTLNISGGVIAANKASNAGGGVYFEHGYLNISGNAVISGNQANNYGGGLYVYNAYPFNMTGGYVTNNRTTTYCGDAKNDHGGGGIHVRNYEFNFQDGYVTGNYSAEGGGGVFVGRNYDGEITSAQFHMTGGIVASNYTSGGEGGGIRITWGTTGKIEAYASDPLYITNNVTATNHDWGGGGIFVQENGTLNIMNTLITDNSSGGYGGGVGACPTGKTLIVHTEGAAIYDNTSSGTNMSGGSNEKNADTKIAKEYFGSSFKKYEDYFCVRSKDNANDDITLVTGEMIGNGAANWSGMRDYQELVDISKTGSMAAKYLFALSADPDDAAKAAAVAAAGVIITGNHSNIHGGGIMTNGGLIIGRTSEVVYAPPSLEIQGEKALMVGNTSQNTGLDFEFELVDSLGANANVIGTAKANPTTGAFTIHPEDAEHTAAGTYTYYLREKNDGRTGVTYDTTVYKIVVTITSSEVTLMGIRFVSFNVSSVSVSKVGDDDSSGDSSATETVDNTFKIHYKNTNNWGTVSLHIWNDEGVLGGETTFPGYTLLVDNNSTNSSNRWYTKVFNNVATSNDFNYIFSNNGSNQTADLSGSYGPGKELWVYADTTSVTAKPSDYVSDSSGTVVDSNLVTQSDSRADGTIVLTFKETAFTNTKNLPLKLRLTKTDGGSKTLSGAEFTLKVAGETSGTTVTTGANGGIAEFTNLSRDNTTYYLYETKAPDGYAAAGPWIIELGSDDTATIWPATENPNTGALVKKTGESGTTMGKTTENGAIVLSTTITNKKLTSLKLTKLWQDGQGDTVTTNIPDSITVQLQKSQDGVQWASVMDRTITPVNGEWKTTFENLDVYVDHTASNRVKWQYRVVEKNGSGSPVTESGPITLQDGMQFNVSYGKVEGDADKGFSQTITNMEASTSLTVTKKWTYADGETVLPDAYIPDEAYIQLYSQLGDAKAEYVKDYVLKPADGETWADYTLNIKDLPKTDASGTEYKYFVLEKKAQNGAPANGGDTVTAANQYEFTVSYSAVTENTDKTVGGYVQTITNAYDPKIDISVNKAWPGINSNDLSAVMVRLERKLISGSWDNSIDVDTVYTAELTEEAAWSHTFEDLPVYNTSGVQFEYRVVELTGTGENQTAVANDGYIVHDGRLFKVTYSNPNLAGSNAPDTTNWTITNTAQTVKLDITKQSSVMVDGKYPTLNGATFKLEKQTETPDVYTQVGDEVTTSGGGKAQFSSLSCGVYRLTETQAAPGYSLLASPIKIEITANAAGNFTIKVDGTEQTVAPNANGVCTYDLTIYNKPQLQMPATGGVGGFEFWILGGLLIMAVPLLMYTFIWYRKGGKYLQR